jgi:hypothetical protein
MSRAVVDLIWPIDMAEKSLLLFCRNMKTNRRVKVRTWYGMGGTVIIILVIYKLIYVHMDGLSSFFSEA